jgi:AcrR family transcriptional regulator
MSSKETKRKILDTALLLFNRDGFVNVRLQHISDEAILSLGNITYHYRTKDDMIQAIWTELKEAQIRLLSEFRALPLFEDIERYMDKTFELHQKYLFFYTDTLEVMRAYEVIAEQYREHLSWQQQQIYGMLVFNQARAALNAPLYEQHYQELANLWLWLSEGWVNRQAIIGHEQATKKSFQETLWSILRPLFTSQGASEFNQIMELKQTDLYV